MKKLILGILMVIATMNYAFAQELDIKKNVISLDGKEVFKIKKSNPINISITDLEDNELIILRFIHESIYGSVYNKIIFLNEDITFTTQSYVFELKLLVKKLVADKVLTLDGTIDFKKATIFAIKYDERVENKFDRR